MDNRPSTDRELLIPLLIAGFSIIGIVVVLLIGRALNAPAEVAMTPSATPFQYLYLGTEPAVSTSFVEGSVLPPTNEFPLPDTPSFVNPTPPSASTPLILATPVTTDTSPVIELRTNTPGAAPTSTLSTPATVNMVDDTDSRLDYVGNWDSEAGVSGAYQGTMHVSSVTGSYVSFTFTGPEIHLYYQAGPSFGSITITIDGVGEPPLPQSENPGGNREWLVNDLTADTHVIRITHASGGSINIDAFLVPTPTPTPTRTPTSTP